MKLTVIIPCYNGETFLAQAIGSVLEQTRPPAEIILVDDGSTDGSLDIARSFGQRVTILSQNNEGAARARNEGYEHASGDALMFLDADDVLGPTVLEELTGALAEYPRSIAICPWYRLEKVDGRWIRRPPSYRPRRYDQNDLSAWLSRWYHPPCSVLWSREAYERIGGWDERVTVNDDGDIMMRALIDGIPLTRTSSGAAFYRRVSRSGNSLSSHRYSRSGVESELYVFAKIAYRLQHQDRLARYSVELGQAFDDLAGVCKGRYPDLFEQCKEYARRYDRPWLIRAARRQIHPHSYRLQQWALDRKQEFRAGPPSGVPATEIRYGMKAAEEALTADRPTHHQAAPTSRPRRELPVASIVIAARNHADELERALTSVFDQTFTNHEVIVVDDGSTDDTQEVVQAYPEVGYVRHASERGIAAARNVGLRRARGRYIAFLDPGCEWKPEKLEKQVQHFEELPEHVGLLYVGAERVGADGTVTTYRPEHRGEAFEALLVENLIPYSSGVVIRRNVIRAAGFFDEALPAIQDYDYWLRIARFYQVDFIAEPLLRSYEYERAGREPSETHADLEAFDRFFEKHRADMQRAGVTHLFLRESTRQHLANGSDQRRGVRSLAWKAVLAQPLVYDTYKFLLRTHLADDQR